MRSLPLRCAGSALALAWGLWLSGCGAAVSPSSGNGALNVHLVDGPALEFRQINLAIERVEIGDRHDGWRTLATPRVTVDLLTLRGGVSATLVSGATLPAGRYGQLRLILGAGNTLELADGVKVPLTVPSGLRSGLKLLVEFDVAAGTTKDIYLDFDAHRSIQVHRAGVLGKYVLRPTVRAYDLIATGSVSGQVRSLDDGSPLGGAVVMAQSLDPDGKAAIARTTVTKPDGGYTLDLLPAGQTYFVVTQPVIGGKVYAAAASDGIRISSDAPTAVWSVAVPSTAWVGAIAGTVAATGADHVDTVSVARAFQTDGVERELILRSEVVSAVDEDGAYRYRFDALPEGGYTVTMVRVMLGPDGAALATISFRSVVRVIAGQVVPLNL